MLETYTYGSKCEQKVAAAFFFKTLKTLITPKLFNYETEPLFLMPNKKVWLLALKKFSTLTKTYKKFVIYTDSFSAVKSLQGKTFRTKNIKRFHNLLADRLAKAALTSSLVARSHVCWSDFKSIVLYIYNWKELWNNETRNKLWNTSKLN